jgi:hypothetical protein
MMFIVRTEGPAPAGVAIKMQRRTPLSAGAIMDFFCLGDIDAVRARGLTVVPVHDGWYPDDTGGGIAVFGQGRFWEVRDTPFTVRETDGTQTSSGAVTDEGGVVNVRNAIFGV